VPGVSVDEALRRACALARRGVLDVEPNPPVGAVVLAAGEVVGEGWHRAYGAPHAEIEALAAAGERARGGTLVLTLEPCSTHGKTPPCTQAVRRAGLARLVVGAVDPNPAHRGAGLDALARAGLAVERREDPQALGLLSRFVRELDAPRPHVLCKWAMSRDGAIAPPPGADAPREISCEASRARVHAWRAHLDAIAVGVGTVIADDPLLTPRGVAFVRPSRRIVLDPRLRTPLEARLVRGAREHPTWILARAPAPSARVDALEREGARVIVVDGRGERWLGAALLRLRREGVARLMIEGGAATTTRALAAGLVDQVAVFVAPRALGRGAVPALTDRSLPGEDLDALARALDLVEPRIEGVGEDRLLRGWRRDAGD